MPEDKVIKVRITAKVCGFFYEGRNYRPGEVVELPERLFVAYSMERVPPSSFSVEIEKATVIEPAPSIESGKKERPR